MSRALMDDPERLEPGRAAFNRGDYFLAHELWEEAWHELEGPGRIFVQGLIQIAAGLHHLQQRRPRPGAGLLRKGLEKLALDPPWLVRLGVDVGVDALARDVARLVLELETPGAAVPDLSALKLELGH
jgi:hypothetical protein